MKDLPNVSAFPIDKELRNSQERFYGNNEIFSNNSKESVISKINRIFSSNNHVYKSRVKIKTKDDLFERMIIGKTNDNLLTLNGEKIKIKDIIDIEKL